MSDHGTVDITADVLVIGGGAAGVWAAWSAANAGADVVLVDKGYVGTSGATAVSGNHVWSVPPDPEQRARARTMRDEAAGYLTDHGWIDRVVAQSWENMQQIGHWGYPFPDEGGKQMRSSLQGPEYMKLMRRVVRRAGVRIFDRCPALELLQADDGTVVGATGVRIRDDATWTVRAGAVVLTTGGTAFLTRITGTNNDTGDGALMAVEAGAELSGMEFSNQYAVSAPYSSHTKGFVWIWASFYTEGGESLGGRGPGWQQGIARHLLAGEQVFAQIDRADNDEMRDQLRRAAPNFFLPHDRHGIDPFRERFPVTLRLEGTVRGTGGIRLADEGCATGVPGLYAAGDAATREYVAGGTSGGGSRNAAWAMTSGRWAGRSAAQLALDTPGPGDRRAVRTGRAGVRGERDGFAPEAREVIAAVQDEVVPFEKNLFRNGPGLRDCLVRLDELWGAVHGDVRPGPAREIQRAREAASLVAHARWAYASALRRSESRGMHSRTDHPERDEGQRHRIVVAGLDELTFRYEPVSN